MDIKSRSGRCHSPLASTGDVDTQMLLELRILVTFSLKNDQG
ncbi:hypothetical protein ACFSE1_12255 [Rhizobium helianthi]|uniref:Uncharacterized protein n=1 Tax=Rhizobium helianthi TaxID=1132695 RepID=A0ABW4M5I2_9HYPH